MIIKIDGQLFRRQLGKKCWASLLETYMKENDPSYHVVNNGCSGINSTQLRAHLTELIEKDDDVILLMIGTNNRKLPNGMIVLFHDLIDIMKRLKAMNKKVILMMANPVTSEDDHYVNRLFKQYKSR
ncbi:MAG: SGNH/GDSL hydrolase family protein [Turicibacter sp.]|nr:SGNH/GDSL hydrolase family protein [Turicibacter sp.]